MILDAKSSIESTSRTIDKQLSIVFKLIKQAVGKGHYGVSIDDELINNYMITRLRELGYSVWPDCYNYYSISWD